MDRKLTALKITGSNTTLVLLLAISVCAGIALSWVVWMLLAPLASSFAAVILLTMPAIIYPVAITIFAVLLLLGGVVSLLEAFSSKDTKKFIFCGLGIALLVIGVRFSLIVILVYTKVF